jgi:hypothetical protein
MRTQRPVGRSPFRLLQVLTPVPLPFRTCASLAPRSKKLLYADRRSIAVKTSGKGLIYSPSLVGRVLAMCSMPRSLPKDEIIAGERIRHPEGDLHGRRTMAQGPNWFDEFSTSPASFWSGHREDAKSLKPGEEASK